VLYDFIKTFKEFVDARVDDALNEGRDEADI
jgi:hypothetical protein